MSGKWAMTEGFHGHVLSFAAIHGPERAMQWADDWHKREHRDDIIDWEAYWPFKFENGEMGLPIWNIRAVKVN